jgi:hypothetical protein
MPPNIDGVGRGGGIPRSKALVAASPKNDESEGSEDGRPPLRALAASPLDRRDRADSDEKRFSTNQISPRL